VSFTIPLLAVVLSEPEVDVDVDEDVDEEADDVVLVDDDVELLLVDGCR